MDRDRYGGEIAKSKKIYISHLDYDVICSTIQTTEESLRKSFEKYGEIESVNLKKK